MTPPMLSGPGRAVHHPHSVRTIVLMSSRSPVLPSLRRRRWALYALFLLPGLSMSAWVTRTPAVRDLLEASTAQMGLVLFGLSVGSMAGILSSGPLVMRLGTRPVVILGSTLVVVALPTIALGAGAGLPLLTAVGLALFGGGMGGGEVAMKDRKSTRLNSSHQPQSRMPSSA